MGKPYWMNNLVKCHKIADTKPLMPSQQFWRKLETGIREKDMEKLGRNAKTGSNKS